MIDFSVTILQSISDCWFADRKRAACELVGGGEAGRGSAWWSDRCRVGWWFRGRSEVVGSVARVLWGRGASAGPASELHVEEAGLTRS